MGRTKTKILGWIEKILKTIIGANVSMLGQENWLDLNAQSLNFK